MPTEKHRHTVPCFGLVYRERGGTPASPVYAFRDSGVGLILHAMLRVTSSARSNLNLPLAPDRNRT